MITFKQLKEKTDPAAINVPKKTDTMGVKRSQMPQISGDLMKGFLDALKKQTVHVDHRVVAPGTLTATQGNFDKKKVASIVDSMQGEKKDKKPTPIIVSKDNKILDGHHRWLAHQHLNEPITIARVNKKAGELMSLMKGHEVAATNKMFEAILEAYDDKYELFEAETCPVVTAAYLKEFEKFADRLFAKFKIDIDFTKHFRERISDSRNNPCITMKEIGTLFSKLYNKIKEGGKSIQNHKNAEVVIKDIQSDLNIPVAIEYSSMRDEFRIAAKTIMRKKNFGTPNPIIKV